jgi:hypothetical protein
MPCHAAEANPQGKVQAGNQLIAEIRAEGKFTDYTSAREEARRRAPALFDLR